MAGQVAHGHFVGLKHSGQECIFRSQCRGDSGGRVVKQPVTCPKGHWIDDAKGSASVKRKYTSNCVPLSFCVTL